VSPARTADFLVIGGGVIGLTTALELRRRYPDTTITLLEKEASAGEHASGRNSGVLHAGFYYSEDSLKARFTRQGNQLMTAYCDERGLPINRCGKLVVAKNESELAGLRELLRRAQVNDIPLHDISAAEARAIEPRARTHERALFSPTTSSVDPLPIMGALTADAIAAQISIRTGVAYETKRDDSVITSAGPISAGYVVNAAGLHADTIARDFGFSRNHRILPFKGVYLYGDDSEALRTNVYPVPNLAQPFLGVHFTVTVTGRTKIGPTAMPAFWREQYAGLSRFNAREMVDIAAREALLLLRNSFGFRTLALAELRKYNRRILVALAAPLVDGLDEKRYTRWGRAGIRAQLLDTRTNRLEMDFRVEGDERSMHVLNAVSPAFTCSIPFARHVVDSIDRAVGVGATSHE
jgi:L-2-hydroxyglutarate oxidase